MNALTIQSDDSQSLPLELVERVMLQMPQAECPVIHHHGPGTYTREVHIPAGVFAIGHHQNFEHTNIMLKGRVTVLNDDGTTSELAAPMFFVGKPGRKIGYIHEDMVWLNVYATNETDVEKLEAHFLTKSDSWLDNAEEKQKLIGFQHSLDHQDYLNVLQEFGFTEEQARSQAYNEEDQTALPHGCYKVKIADSGIEGRGLFATACISEGEIIAPARINGLRTIAGRFTNHSTAPNARMVQVGISDIALMATRPIQGCHGGEDGEEITINYREALRLTLQIGMD